MTAREQMIEVMAKALCPAAKYGERCVVRDEHRNEAENALDALTPGLVWDWLIETGYVKQTEWSNSIMDDIAEGKEVFVREDFSQKFGVQRDHPGMSGIPVTFDITLQNGDTGEITKP